MSSGHARISSSFGSSAMLLLVSGLVSRLRTRRARRQALRRCAASQRGAVVGFEVEPEQRLGVARTEIEPPVAHVDREAVETILHAVAVHDGHALDHRERIGDTGVDLARLRVAVVRLAQLGERRARLRQLLEHDERGDDAGVGPEVLPEVVVRGVLAAEHRVGVGHDLLHERVADAALDRLAAELADHLGPRASDGRLGPTGGPACSRRVPESVARYQPGTSARVEELRVLSDLHDRGKLSDEEFAAEKSRLMNP